MSYNRIARYALSGESSPHFYPEGEQISMIDITMNEESEPILAGRSDLLFLQTGGRQIRPYPDTD